MGLFDVTNAALEVALHGSEMRQAAISNNLANANTPGFAPSDVSFESALQSALASSPDDPAAVASVEPTSTVATGVMRVDGSGVDVDRESADLAKTQIVFDAAMAIDTSRLHTLSQLITSAH